MDSRKEGWMEVGKARLETILQLRSEQVCLPGKEHKRLANGLKAIEGRCARGTTNEQTGKPCS